MGTSEKLNTYQRTLPFVEIMDSTLRDGEQTNGVSFLPHEKLVIARKLLSDVKVDRIEVASARVSEGERDAVSKICAYAQKQGLLEHVEVLGFVDGGKSIDWIASCGGRVVNLLAKGGKTLQNVCSFNALEKVVRKETKRVIVYASLRRNLKSEDSLDKVEILLWA